LPALKKLLEPRLAIRAVYTVVLAALLLLLVLLLTGAFHGGRGLLINEVMPANRSTIADVEGGYPGWFEIHNRSSQAVSMKGYWATNDPEDPFLWQFPEVTVEPEGYLVIFTSGKDSFNPEENSVHTGFTLSASGSELLLIDPEASVADRVIIPETLSNVSYGRVADNPKTWAYFLDATPGAANEAEPYETITEMPRADEAEILINEFLSVNRTSLPDEDGDASDWVEIYNPGTGAVDLTGYWLSDKTEDPFRWRFPSLSIDPGEYLVLFASGKNRYSPDSVYLHTSFSLNDRNDNLILSRPDGTIVDEIEIRNMEPNVSYGRDPANPDRWLYFPRPTPGEENYTQGFESFSGTPVPGLLFSEVMAVNVSTLADEDGDYSDWLEIYNPESYPVNLEGYTLSDSERNPHRWEFPALTVNPGEALVVFASGKDRRDPDGAFLHTNFKIRAAGETLVFHHPSGLLLDSMPTGMLSADLSAGRLLDGGSKRYFFAVPSPGEVNNSEALSGYSRPLGASHQGGFYEEAFYLQLEAPAPGVSIRYTLDGSEPDQMSAIYDSPLRIEQTSVVRARAFEENKLPGPTLNRTFLVGEEHSLPVVSVLMAPRDLWDPVEGIYVMGYNASSRFPFHGANFWKDMEKEIHFELYEPDGTLGISADAGIKIGGQFSRGMDQKIFNVHFRNMYGSNEIRYPLFPGKELSRFTALTLRTSGQDAVFSKIRDIMMASLLEDTGLDYQAHRQAVLYLNGEYWGIYNIRERANRHFIADNHDLDPDKIDLLQANWVVRAGSNEDYLAMLDFVRNNDLAVDENYSYIQTRMDVTNFIDALIAQVFYAQTDQGNIRYWREQSPEGKWRWLAFDFDWCFWPGHLNNNTLASMTNPAGTGAYNNISTVLTVNLLRNRDFRDELVQRFAYHLNHTFEPERVINRIDELALNIEPEVQRHFERWPGSVQRWKSEIEQMKEFARLRPAVVMEHIRQKFRLSSEEMQIFNGWQS
jgi:hypothetical protein